MKLIILGAAFVLWPLLMFVHPWGGWFGFWHSPFWAATELLVAALSLCLSRVLGGAMALLLGAHWLFYHGVATDDVGMPLLRETFVLWLDRAWYQPIYFGGHVLAALILVHGAVSLVKRSSLP
jgi:hypothetical protein